MKEVDLSQISLLTQDDDGTLRLQGSRVTVDALIAAYRRGDTPDQIHEGFPSLSVDEIQKAIDWYLANRNDVDNYLKDRVVQAESMRRCIESRPDQAALREMLRERRS
jgi:uncharacterized protein (DUF433 family)